MRTGLLIVYFALNLHRRTHGHTNRVYSFEHKRIRSTLQWTFANTHTRPKISAFVALTQTLQTNEFVFNRQTTLFTVILAMTCVYFCLLTDLRLHKHTHEHTSLRPWFQHNIIHSVFATNAQAYLRTHKRTFYYNTNI